MSTILPYFIYIFILTIAGFLLYIFFETESTVYGYPLGA